MLSLVAPVLAQKSDFGYNIGDPSPAYPWRNELEPPILNNPTCYIGKDSIPVFTKRSENSATCSGDMYIVRGNKDEDIFIDLQGETLHKPLLTQSGNNIIVLNGVIDMQTPPGCESGALDYNPRDKSAGKSLMPRVPASRLLGFGNYGVSWVEGMLFLANGHQTDVIVANSGEGRKQTPEDALLRREHYVVNTRAEGWEGTKAYLHGDFIQSQAQIAKGIYIENVTALSAYQWIIFGAKKVWVKNYYVDIDPTYGYDDPETDLGPGLKNYVSGIQTNASNEYYKNIHFRLPNGSSTGTGNFGPNPNRVDPRAPKSHDTTAIPDKELHRIPGDASTLSINPPPVKAVDFAPREHVGKHYESPFTYNYCQAQ